MVQNRKSGGIMWTLKTLEQKVKKSPFIVANKEEITMPEALENQHRCGYTHPHPPPLHAGVPQLAGVRAGGANPVFGVAPAV